MKLPPSFQPREQHERPVADDAKVIKGRIRPMSSFTISELNAASEPTSQQAAKPSRSVQPQRRRPAPQPRRESNPAPQRQQAVQPTEVAPPSFQPQRRTQTSAQHPQQRQRPVARPQSQPQLPQPPAQRRPALRKRRKPVRTILLILLVLAIAWPGYLYWHGNNQLQHVAALSGAPDTPGRTVLFAGTDARTEDGINDGIEGQRSDSIMLVHVPESGNPSLISLPRDTYVEIPNYGPAKLNAAYAHGGPELLVTTVESMTGLTIDNYVEVGMGGITNLVDAVGGVNLCLDYDVNDVRSELVWTAGCHDADGKTALAFSRMRYSDPLGDIGRTQRQRQVIAKIFDKAASPATLFNPFRQRDLVGSATSVLTVDNDTSLMDLAGIAWPMRTIMGADGIIGTPPIVDYNYRPGGVGSTVLLNPETIDQFWAKVADGSITKADVEANLP